jgi:hypothetical protein
MLARTGSRFQHRSLAESVGLRFHAGTKDDIFKGPPLRDTKSKAWL